MKDKLQCGFSLLEMMVTLIIITIVIAVVMQAVVTMEARNTVESGKVDLTQQSREFMDQIVSDIHQSGFPSIRTADPTTLGLGPGCASYSTIACGLISVAPSALQFEGDVDGSGVSEVYIQEVPAGGPCPCTIQRGTLPKSQYIANPAAQPPYYTEVTNVMNTAIFTAYDSSGTANPVSGNIAAIQITLYVRALQPDPKTNQYPTVTMVSGAKITN